MNKPCKLDQGKNCWRFYFFFFAGGCDFAGDFLTAGNTFTDSLQTAGKSKFFLNRS